MTVLGKIMDIFSNSIFSTTYAIETNALDHCLRGATRIDNYVAVFETRVFYGPKWAIALLKPL